MKHLTTLSLLASMATITCAGAYAAGAQPPAPEDLSEPPPMTGEQPAAGATGENIEPDVTITTHGEDRYEEYRIRGQLYMIKVTPAHGKPYYLIDNEGSGQFSRSEFAPSIKVPMWVIKRF